MPKVYIYPRFEGPDDGDGGIRRVVEAQRRHLPAVGWEIAEEWQNADVIACHIMLGSEAQHYGDKPLVVHNHGLYWAEYDWAQWALKANAGCMEAIRQADAITAPSEWVAQSIRRNSLRPVTVIGHGIDMEDWPARQGDKGFVLWNKTRMDAVCDPASLSELARRAPDVSFISTYGDDLPNLALTGRLPYDKARQAVQDAAVYLCTARETFGIGTIEALAAGVPVLAWRWGGQTEIIEHKQTGWLATPGDYDDLLTGLRYCLENKERLSRAARTAAMTRYQWKDVIGGYADLYAETLAHHQEEQTRPHVSVVVPAYKLAELLPRALESISNQTMEDWECIIIDDASPDAGWRVAQKAAKVESRFRLVRNKQNEYLAGSLNIGIAESKGRYVIPLDADNELAPNTLALLAAALDADRSLEIAYGNVEFVEEDGKRWHSGWPMQFRADWQVMHGRNMIPSSAMYRRRVWELTGGYRRRYRTAEDADFWTRAASYGFRAKMVTEADTLIYYNREGSMSRVEPAKDWTLWYPWSAAEEVPPAAFIGEAQGPVPSCDPPFISIVIPVGPGHEELLVDALDSVDAQTWRLWECLVVNDTGAPLRWLPSWARELRTAGRVGVAAARNVGLRAAQGNLFLPLDADDTLEPRALESLLRVQQQFKGYVYSDWFEMFKDETRIWNTPEYLGQDLIENGCLHAITALYPRSAWEAAGGFDEELPAWEDWDFQLKLCDLGICGTRLPVPLFTYRKETGQRRAANFAAFEESKAGILDKWRDYFEGRKRLMGCSACPGGGGGQVAASSFQQGVQRAELSDDPANYAVVEYIGNKEGAMAFNAPSGVVYYFSAVATERQKYVRADDAEWFASKSQFRIRRPDAVPA